jgi:tetratricopeptide (TPR) repeat protein
LSSQYFDPASGQSPDFNGYQADTYIVESTRLSEKFAAYNDIGDAWDERSRTFIVHLTLLAVSLSLFGLSTTIHGFMSKAFIALGTVVSIVVVIWAAFVMLKPLPSLPDTAIEAYSQGVGLAWRGKYQEAVQQFDAALAMEPGYANALYERGNAYFWLSDYPTSLRDYEAAIQAGREDTNAGWNLGWTYYLMGRYDDAIRMDRAVLEKDPSLVGVRFNLALALMVNGQFSEAEKEYQAGVDQAIQEMKSAREAGKQPPSAFWYYMDASAADIDNLLSEMNGSAQAWGQAPKANNISADHIQVRALADRMFYLLKDTTAALEFTGNAPPQTPRAMATAFQFGHEELDKDGNFVRYNTATSFPYGMDEVLVLFDYSSVKKGAPEVWKVYRDGVEDPTLRVVGSWKLEEAGSAAKPISYAYSSLFIFTPGHYTVELYIDSHLVGRGNFTVEEEK